MTDLKPGDYVRGNVVRKDRIAEGMVLGIKINTVSIETEKGERLMLEKTNLEKIGIGTRIKDRRNELDIKQAKLAERLGVNQSKLSQWETGKIRPPADLIPKIEKALGIDLTESVKVPFNGVTVSYDPSVIKKKEVAPLREKDILDTEGNFKNKVPAFKEPEKKDPEVEQVAPAHPWRSYEKEVAAKVEPRAIPALPPEVCEKLDAQMDAATEAIKSELKGDNMTVSIETGSITFAEPTKEIFINSKPLHLASENTTLDLDEILTAFFPRFGNFHADYQLAGAFELLLQAEAGNACLDDLRKARAKLDKAIACLEK